MNSKKKPTASKQSTKPTEKLQSKPFKPNPESPRHLNPKDPQSSKIFKLNSSRSPKRERPSIPDSNTENMEQIVSEIDLEIDTPRQTDSNRENLKGSMTSSFNNSKLTKIKTKNEKNFKDLNKSLANLASRRVLGRSSSDNDAISYISPEITRQTGFNFEFQPHLANPPTPMIETPSMDIKNGKNYQTSVKKEVEITPASFYENRKNRQNKSNMDVYRHDLALSDVDYNKFQIGCHQRDNKSPLNTTYTGKPARKDDIFRRLSDWESQKVGLSYAMASLKTEEAHQVNRSGTNEKRFLKAKSRENSGAQPTTAQGTSEKERSKNSPVERSLRNKIDNHNRNQRKGSNLTHDTLPEADHYERLQFNTISDGVEYSKGGLGVRGISSRNIFTEYHNIPPKTSYNHDDQFIKTARKFGKDRLSVEKDTLDVWKRDLSKIREDMERRKESYEAVNKFVHRIVEGGESPRSRIVKDPFNGGSYGGFSDKSENEVVHISKIERENYSSTNTPTLGSPAHKQGDRSRTKERTKKTSFEFIKTTENNENEDVNTKVTGETQKLRAKASAYEFTHETFEMNNSFTYGGTSGLKYERQEKVI